MIKIVHQSTRLWNSSRFQSQKRESLLRCRLAALSLLLLIPSEVATTRVSPSRKMLISPSQFCLVLIFFAWSRTSLIPCKTKSWLILLLNRTSVITHQTKIRNQKPKKILMSSNCRKICSASTSSTPRRTSDQN